MRHFKHHGKRVLLARSTLPSHLVLYPKVMANLGQIFNIVAVESCTVKNANSSTVCGADPKCPGRIRLDRPPFDYETRCYCWNDQSIFDFLEE